MFLKNYWSKSVDIRKYNFESNRAQIAQEKFFNKFECHFGLLDDDDDELFLWYG